MFFMIVMFIRQVFKLIVHDTQPSLTPSPPPCATEAALHSLLGPLTSETYDDPTQHLEREQALAKQFAEILHFTLRFDELKVRPITSLGLHFYSILPRVPSILI